MRGAVLVSLLLLAGVGRADPASGYFELGVDYLKKGFFQRAIDAFGESLMFEPGQGVPLVFAGIAASCDGQPTRLCARAIRVAYRRLPENTVLRLNLQELLPHPRSRSMVEREFLRRAKRARTLPEQRDALTVAAFFRMHQPGANAAREPAAALDALRKQFPDDAWAGARHAERKQTELPAARTGALTDGFTASARSR
ncbi:MAG: hypothetical protein V3T86_02705 [Planctomycetota bacterium]